MNATRVCSFEDCGRPHSCRGLCRTHYEQFRLTGTVKKIQPWDRSLPLKDRFWAKVNKTEGCWEWQAGKVAGYGQFHVNGKKTLAHRYSYELANGPFDEALEIDHICRNPLCVRPSHLRTATRKQNQEHHGGAQSNNKTGVRGVSWSKGNQMWVVQVAHYGVTKCKYFHDFDDAARAAVEMRNEAHTRNNLDRAA